MWARAYCTPRGLRLNLCPGHPNLSNDPWMYRCFISSSWGRWEVMFPSHLFSFEYTQIKKGDSKRREGLNGVWFVAHRRICGVYFRRWTPSACLCQTVISCCVAPSNWCKENHNRCEGNKQLPAIFFLTLITSYQTKAWVYREERVCHVAYPDTASSDVQSRCCLCLWVCDM